MHTDTVANFTWNGVLLRHFDDKALEDTNFPPPLTFCKPRHMVAKSIASEYPIS